MALSGSITGTLNDSQFRNHYNVRIDWSATQDASSNKSTVKCDMYFVHDIMISIGARTHTVTIGDSTYSISYPDRIQTGNGYHEHYIGTVYHTVSHNADGTISPITISAVFSFKATLQYDEYSEAKYFSSINALGQVQLDTIIREASTPTLSDDEALIGGSITIYTNAASDTLYHTAFYSLDGETFHWIESWIKSSYTWNIPSSLASESEENGRFPITILLETFSDKSSTSEVYIGGETVTFTAVVPIKPTATMTLEAIYPTESWVTTPYVQGKSKVKATFTAGSITGATISTYTLSVADDKTTSSDNTLTSNFVKKSGTVSVKGIATDSRGVASEEISEDILVVPYGKPTLSPFGTNSEIVCARCDEQGELSADGTRLKVTVRGKWFSLLNGENKATLEIKYASDNDNFESDWISQEVSESGGGSNNNYVSWFDFNGIANGISIDSTKEYAVSIRCVDRFGNISLEYSFSIPSQEVNFHQREGGKGASFGEYATEENVFSIAETWKAKFKGGMEVKGYPLTISKGTWTPTINSGEFMAYNAVFYKIGCLVYVHLSGSYTNGEPNDIVLQLGGLPYKVAVDCHGAIVWTSMRFYTASSHTSTFDSVSLEGIADSNHAEFRAWSEGRAWGDILDTCITDGSIRATLIYITEEE